MMMMTGMKNKMKKREWSTFAEINDVEVKVVVSIRIVGCNQIDVALHFDISSMIQHLE
jgi:hypothetical protein